jgi:hypothetical protein
MGWICQITGKVTDFVEAESLPRMSVILRSAARSPESRRIVVTSCFFEDLHDVV